MTTKLDQVKLIISLEAELIKLKKRYSVAELNNDKIALEIIVQEQKQIDQYRQNLLWSLPDDEVIRYELERVHSLCGNI